MEFNRVEETRRGPLATVWDPMRRLLFQASKILVLLGYCTLARKEACNGNQTSPCECCVFDFERTLIPFQSSY
jgi:hypothetical protein